MWAYRGLILKKYLQNVGTYIGLWEHNADPLVLRNYNYKISIIITRELLYSYSTFNVTYNML